MEEKEVLSVFQEMFDKALPVFKSIREGFDRENGKTLKEGLRNFREIIKSSLPFFESITKKQEKDDVDKKAIDLLVSAQMVASGIENLVQKMITKLESHVLFSDRAKKEINDLTEEIEKVLRDVRDFIITKNPELKEKIEERTDRTIKMAYEFDTTHQKRLITGICMPKASYLFLEMTDSIRKVAREMRNLAEKV